MNPRMEVVSALDAAIDAIKDEDGGDPVTDTGWRSDELCDHFCILTALRDYFLNSDLANGTLTQMREER